MAARHDGAAPRTEARAERWETRTLQSYSPDLAASGVAHYVHQYNELAEGGQELSTQMRELLAIIGLISKAEGVRFAASHVRRLYHMGVTSAVVVEALWAAEPVFGRANMLRGIQAIRLANDPSNTEGRLPQGGEPTEMVDFPELHLGEDHRGALETERGLGASPEMAYVARIDPKLAELAVAHHNLVYQDGGVERDALLSPAAMELIAIAALCIRGAIDLAAEHMRRAQRHGATARQILEAISAVVPPTGQATLRLGARAMMRAGIEP
jgi:alkylhydroperoxidase/carboxymuconolactone decarboxylase family protein YurZ